MQNTVSTKHGRVELLGAGKDVNNLISSIENSSVEILEDRPMQSKLAKHGEHIMVSEQQVIMQDDSCTTPEISHPPINPKVNDRNDRNQ